MSDPHLAHCAINHKNNSSNKYSLASYNMQGFQPLLNMAEITTYLEQHPMDTAELSPFYFPLLLLLCFQQQQMVDEPLRKNITMQFRAKQ